MTSPIAFSILLVLSGAWAEEVATPSSRLFPRNFNHHSYQIKQYLKLMKKPEPTKQGPVLFPDNGAPPPRLPLVVTTRPLLEAIASSDLNPSPPNNSVAEQSQLSHVALKPYYITNFNGYGPLTFSVTPLPPPAYEVTSLPESIPYADLVNKARSSGASDNRYSDYEERTSLPPIYKALSDYAQRKVLRTKQKPQRDYKIHKPDYERDYENNELANDDDNTEYNEGDNYAFSYRVKDQKTGDDFSHTQQSSGAATNGEYRVRLPDGRTQIVSYTADEGGYKADVRYDNEDTDKIDTKPNDYDANNNEYGINDDANRFNDRFNSDPDQTRPDDYNSRIDNDYSRDYVRPVKEYFRPYEASKEYFDYSGEYSNYEAHRSKFAAFQPSSSLATFTTARPQAVVALEPTGGYVDAKVDDEEDVVVIAPRRYTHVSSGPLVQPGVTPSPPVTPAGYLASTIASIKDRIRASKPILANDFLQRINKYLSFT